MTFKTHLAASASLCAALSYLGFINIATTEGKIVVASVALGGMIPDIDSPNSKINGILWRFSPIKPRHVFAPTYNHRKYPTHWALFWLAVLAMLYYYLILNHHSTAWLFGLTIGVAGHLFCDMFNFQGLMLLMPFSHKRFRFAQITTGSIGEYIFLLLIAVPFIIIACLKSKLMLGG